MRSKIIKRMTGIGAVVLTGIIVFCGIQNSILTVNAADTLFGIERLRQEVQDRGEESPYTILELVPDEAAAEIGYYVPGYEPALSDRSADGSGKWSDWRKGLAKLRTQAERTAYMNTLKQKLDSFYRARGFDDRDKVPVSYQEYRESATHVDGYTQLSFADELRYGYFEPSAAADIVPRYQVKFVYVVHTGEPFAQQEQYYKIDTINAITMAEYDTLDDAQIVYKKNYNSDGDEMYIACSWGEVKASVSSGNASSSVSGNAAGTDYYRLNFLKWDEANPTAARTALYAVQQFAEKENGEYVFKETHEGVGYTTAFATESVYYTGGFVNQEWFRRNVVDLEQGQTDSFRMQVITLTPGELNALQAAGTIPKYDMLYLNSGLRALPNAATAAPMEQYSVSNDLSIAVRNELFAGVIAEEKPCIVDAALLYRSNGGNIEYNTDLEETQISYLSAMLLQESPKAFSEQLVSGGAAEAVYPDRATLRKGLFVDEDKNFVVEQVYSFFAPTALVSPSFGEFTLYREGQAEDISSGFGEVLDEILSENANRLADTTGTYGQLPTDVSQATVVRHIMNYANRRQIETKKEIHVLEIQPCMSAENSNDLTEEEVRSWITDASGANQSVTVTIERMTTAEFIGRIEDINEVYDLIYIGTDKDYMNMRNGKTIFNDSSMNGLIYYHTGDIRYTGIQLAGQLDTEYVDRDRDKNLYYYNQVRYGGNDITEEKMKALQDFLNASYPIVVSDEFFEGGSMPVDTEAVTVYNADNCPEAANHMSFGVGSDNLDEYYKIDHDINSFKVKEGYRLTLYGRDDNLDYYNSYDGPIQVDTLGNFNNQTQAIKVEFIGKSDYDVNAHINRDKVNEELIDNSSYIYEFVNSAKERTNFYTRSEVKANSGMFRFYLNRPKINIENGFTANGTKKNDVYHINQVNGEYTLEYTFTIRNEGAASADAKYRCQLFIDVNADGKYAKQENLGDIKITCNGQEVKYDELYAGRQYKLVRDIPDGYQGLLPWKVQITQVSNSYVHNGVTGFTKLEGLPQEVLDILQIRKDGNGDSLNLQTAIADENNVYHKLIYGGNIDGVEYEGIEADFDISVECYSISEINDMFTNGQINMEKYNMLILGFSDTYGNLNQTAVDAVVSFVNTGKSVLFAHDTLSFTNHEQGKVGVYDRTTEATREDTDAFNSYLLTRSVRDLAGMDRYGIRTVPGLASGDNIVNPQVLTNIREQYDKDVAYLPRSGRTQSTGLTHGYTYSLINSKNDHNNRSWTNAFFEPNETGLTETFRNQYQNLNFEQVYFREGWYSAGEGDGGNSNNAVTNLWVTKVNDGQITKYPYVLDEEFMVPDTHAQYYQLDFTSDEDGDGQSDVVVWYCLGYRTDDNGNKQNTIYSMSPNDVSNNYYIYNKGSVTYTGVGHSGATTNVNEAKLFINTMIASYNAGIKPPTIAILSEGKADAERIESIYRYYDITNKDSDGNNLSFDGESAKERVYFTVNDVNLVNGTRKISLNCYYETSDAAKDKTIEYEGKQLPVKRLAYKVYEAATGKEVNAEELVSGGLYYILFDKSVMQDYGSRFSVFFEVQSHIKSYSLEYNTDKTYQKLDFTKVMMFDLG